MLPVHTAVLVAELIMSKTSSVAMPEGPYVSETGKPLCVIGLHACANGTDDMARGQTG